MYKLTSILIKIVPLEFNKIILSFPLSDVSLQILF